MIKTWLFAAPKTRVPKDLLILLAISGLYFLSLSLSNTFVNVFLWKHTKNLIDIGFYNLMIVLFQPVTFLIAGRLAKKIDRVLVLRTGISFLALFFVSVLFLGAHARQFLLLFGGLLGIGYGFYWCAFNVLTFEVTEPETRDFFNGFQGLLTALGGMVGAAAGGWLIAALSDEIGYKIIFALSLLLFGIAVFASFFLKRRPAAGEFAVMRIIGERKRNPNWNAVLNARFFQGLREGTFLFFIGILIFLTTKSEWALGKFALVESGIMLLSYYAVSHFVKPVGRKKAILAGGLLLSASVLLLFAAHGFAVFIAYAVVTAGAYPLLSVPYMSLAYDTIGKGWEAGERRVEYIVVLDLFYNAGRLLSILLFLIVAQAFDPPFIALRYFVMGIGAAPLAMSVFVRRIALTDQPREKALMQPRGIEDGESGSTV